MHSTLLIISLLVWPMLYAGLLGVMWVRKVPRPPRVAFLFLFGTVGGWLLTLALSPSGLAASCFVFLATVAPLALLGSSIQLARRPERTVFHQAAMWGGFSYPAWFAFTLLTRAVLQ